MDGCEAASADEHQQFCEQEIPHYASRDDDSSIRWSNSSSAFDADCRRTDQHTTIEQVLGRTLEFWCDEDTKSLINHNLQSIAYRCTVETPAVMPSGVYELAG